MIVFQILSFVVCVAVLFFQHFSQQRALRNLEEMVLTMKKNLERLEKR